MTLPAYAMNASSFPEMYERLLVEPLFRPFAEALLEPMDLRPGQRVLDIACGTGIVARLAKARVDPGGKVVGVDLSPQMLAVARSIDGAIEWREGAAEALPLATDEQFDVVTCHQGFQFFPNRAAAAREMRKALAPGGRLALGAWQSLEAIPFALALNQVGERRLGAITDRRYSIRDAGELREALASAGLADVHVDTVTRTVRFADGMVFVRLNAMALVGMSAGSKAMTDGERADAVARITEESAEVLRAYSTSEGLAFELGTFLATASSPLGVASAG